MSQAVDRDPETVALYVEESLEGLQQIEQLLLAAEAGQGAADLMGTLFRTVHTIKGTAGYLAFERAQALAHAAEDMLSKLRDKRLVARPEHYGYLVAVGDKLRQLVENVRQTNDEGQVEIAALVAQLRASMVADEAASSVAAAALAPPPVPSDLAAPATVTAAVAEVAAASQASAAPLAATDKASAPETKMDVKSDATGEPKAEAADSTVRVNVAVLDRLMNLIGELVLARNQMVQMVKVSTDSSVSTQSVFQRLNIVTSELQEQVMKTRMQPMARVFEKIPRMVRDIARVTGKEVVTQIEGNATEIDKALVEAIRDPVMHIVRNAIDHGIELAPERLAKGKTAHGTLFIRAAHKGGAVAIEVEDDGKGMDPAFIRAHAVKKGVLSMAEAAKLTDREALELVFRPGFSTAAAVTDISGRGVGMDVVRTHVERAGGRAEIESVPGRGSIIRLKMPLTLAIIPALLVRANNQRFAIPQVNLLELVYLTEEQRRAAIETIRGAAIHRLRGEILPMVDLREVLGLPPPPPAAAQGGVTVVVLAVGTRRYSLVVDGIDNTEEIVIKPLRGQLKRLSCFGGATVLGDGGVAFILDVAGLAAKAGLDLTGPRRACAAPEHPQEQKRQILLVFASVEGNQCAVPLSQVARLEQIPRASIEDVANQEVLQYRHEIMPIVRPEALLPVGSSHTSGTDQLLIAFDFGRRVAMAAHKIVDVVEVTESACMADDTSPYVHGKAVIFGKTTLLLNVQQMTRQLLPASGPSAPRFSA